MLTPRVVNVSPANNETNVLPSSPIRVEFNRMISFDQAVEYLVINPPMPGKYVMDDLTLVFTPSLAFRSDEEIKVSLSNGIKSTFGLPLLSKPTWSFQIKHPWLLYLLDNGNQVELYKIDPNGLITSKLIDTTDSILDYSVSPDGKSVYYASEQKNNTLLYEYDVSEKKSTLLHTCQAEICSQPTISKDYKYLSFVSGSSLQNMNPAASRVWLLTMSDEKTIGQPIPASGNNHPTRDASWSARGWLVYYDDEDHTYNFYNPSTGVRTNLKHDTGEIGCWSPDGKLFVYPQIFYPPEGVNIQASYSSQLIGINPETEEQTLLTRNDVVEDVLPEFSPDGKQIAFARRYLTTQNWTPGRQIWFVRSDGSNPRAMTNSENYKHLDFAWRPDGTQIAYIRFNAAEYNQPREVWIMNTKTGVTQKILMDAYQLEWLP